MTLRTNSPTAMGLQNRTSPLSKGTSRLATSASDMNRHILCILCTISPFVARNSPGYLELTYEIKLLILLVVFFGVSLVAVT